MTDLSVTLTLEGECFSKTLRKGCPKGSQLDPAIWNIAMNKGMLALIKTSIKETKTTAYVDDLAGAARVPIAIDRISDRLQALKNWAEYRGLMFSAANSQSMCFKCGKKPDFEVSFRTGADANKIAAANPVTYLGVQIDYKRTFWPQVRGLAAKSNDLFTRNKRNDIS